jgi:hypothetical protein
MHLLSLLALMLSLSSPPPVAAPALLPVPGVAFAELVPGGRTFAAPYLDGCGNVVGLNRSGTLSHLDADVSRDPLGVECGGCAKGGTVHTSGNTFDYIDYALVGGSGRCEEPSPGQPCLTALNCAAGVYLSVWVPLGWSVTHNGDTVTPQGTYPGVYWDIGFSTNSPCGAPSQSSTWTVWHGTNVGVYTIEVWCANCPLHPFE